MLSPQDLLVLDNSENWVVFSVSGDAFLRGQVRKLVGLALAIVRGWLPEWYLDAALSGGEWADAVCDVPAVPKVRCDVPPTPSAHR
jgi:tRNA U38,U39,U40 pseudouridine synthase TruA